MTTSRRPLPANFRAEALRQAREAQRLRGMLDAMKEDIALWAAWMSRGDVWDRVRAACGPGEFGALAERVGLDPATATARDVFLEARAIPAIYSLASDVLNLRPDKEGASRTFPMGNASEAQAHFPAMWPPGSDEAMAAIITALPITPTERRKLESTGLPMLDCMDTFPQHGRRNDPIAPP